MGCRRDLTQNLETQRFFEPWFLCWLKSSFNKNSKIKFPCNFLHIKYQKVKKFGCGMDTQGLCHWEKWKSTNFTTCIKYKVNFHLCGMPSWSDTKFGNTKVLWAMIFCRLKSSFNKNSKIKFPCNFFDIFCIESIKKSKKLGAAWTPRAYAIGKNESQQISRNGLSTR